MEEQREAGGGADLQENREGIRCITEELLLRLTGCRSVALVRSLNLSSSTGDKRIKVIENLHGCQHLEVLKLNDNVIERMESVNSLTQLRELQLAHNNIQRIEGLELMSSLQHLNLSYNRIERIPVWFGRKLHSLHTLHLQHNLITSLYEMSRLRSLSSLSELSVSGNPACSLQHSRLFLLYHLRTLDRLDDLSITQEERGHAHRRFSTEELQRLQQEVDSSQWELSRLQGEQQDAGARLRQQEETNRELMAQAETQRHAHTLLEQELHTKSQLLKKTTAELTGAFHRLYEVEQEFTFYKIDTKLSPLPSCSVQEVDIIMDSENPYIGKAGHVRGTGTPRHSSSSSSLQPQEDADIHAQTERSRPLQEACRTEQREAEAEQQAAERLLTHKQQEALCRLLSKLSVLEQLKDEADETRRQMDRQSEESRKTERETEELGTRLLTLEPTDPQHAHVTAWLSSCRQMLDRMSGNKSELEDRLDDMLSRIAMETQEIKELEQQLTDGQILANEALQRDLEGIICGLQEYLRGLREQVEPGPQKPQDEYQTQPVFVFQARRAQQQVHNLQAENQSLQLHLEEAQRHCRQLEDTSRTRRQDMSVQQEELSALRMETQALRDRQVEDSRQRAELEAELQQLREELSRQVTLGQGEKSSLQQGVQRLQAQLDQTRIQMDQIRVALLDPEEVQGEPVKQDNPEDMLSRSVEQLSRAIQKTRASKKHLQLDQNQEQTARVQAKLDQSQDHITRLAAQVAQDQDWIAELEAQVAQDQDQIAELEAQMAQDQDRIAELEAQVICSVEKDQNSEWRQKAELERLRVQLQRSQSKNQHVQRKLEAELEQNRLQLQDVRQDRDALRQQSDRHQRSLSRLNRKLRQLSRSMCDSEQLTAEQLRSTIEQLRALNHTVELLHTHTEQVHSLGSQGTQDSGLGLQYLSSPEGGRQQDRGQAGGGYWVYVPRTHGVSDAGTDTHVLWRDGDGTPPPPGSAPTVSAGLSDSPVSPAWLLHSPPAGGVALHCSIPEHKDSNVDGCVCECMHKEAERLGEEKKKKRKKKKMKLQLETKQLRRTLRRHQHLMQVCDEVECVEKTLLKRRAELRQADRLLLEAQSCINTTQDKAVSAQQEAEVLQRAAQDGATCLLEALRELQEEVEELRRSRQEEEQTLREVEEALGSRQQELHSATCRLADVLSDCQASQQRLDSLHTQVEQQELRLVQRREEHRTAVVRVEEVREEEQRLHSSIKDLLEQQGALLSQKKSTVSALREDEQRLTTVKSELNTRRAELKRMLQELLVEQHALEEVKTKRSQSLQRLLKRQHQLDRTQDELDRTQDELDKMRGESDSTRGEMDRRKAELDKKQEEVDRKTEEFDQLQEEMQRKRQEMAELQQEVESHRKEAGACLTETKQQQAELQQRQEELSRSREERTTLQEQCKHLEARRRHADRCLSAVEAELAKQREELSHAQLLKQEVLKDTAATQQQLNENSELLNLLSERLEERKKRLHALEQEPSVSSQEKLEQLVELDRQTHHRQAVCVGLDEVEAAVRQLEDRGRRLTQQELLLNQLKDELRERQKQLLHKEEELKLQGEGLQQKEEWLVRTEEELRVKEDQQQQKEEDECFYLSTAGLRSAFSAEEQWWKVELQTEELRQEEDRLKARLRCSLWNQQEALKERRLETEDSLVGLKLRLDQLDSQLSHSQAD